MKTLSFAPVAALVSCLLLYSCVGVSGTVTFGADGSGTASFTYTVSKTVESLGKLEANSTKLPFPVSREDFDRSASRIPGLRLDRWNRKDTADDIVIDVGIAFDSPATFALFLDPEGKRAAFRQSGKEKELSIRLATGKTALDPDLAKFVDTVFAGYLFDVTMKTPSKLVSASPATIDPSGLSARYKVPMNDVLKSQSDILWVIRW
ncbi:MAG: hypothetical protein NT080_14390 [Spirochaetes bacterium]|nr:hypothetical protein [Spirochaetota bacterium]